MCFLCIQKKIRAQKYTWLEAIDYGYMWIDGSDFNIDMGHSGIVDAAG
jgi:hypothetical protein